MYAYPHCACAPTVCCRYAVKTFEHAKCAGDASATEERDRELYVLRLVSSAGHPHIANLIDEAESAVGVHAYLHYCGRGSLMAHVARLRKKQMGTRARASDISHCAIDSAPIAGTALRGCCPSTAHLPGEGIDSTLSTPSHSVESAQSSLRTNTCTVHAPRECSLLADPCTACCDCSVLQAWPSPTPPLSRRTWPPP